MVFWGVAVKSGKPFTHRYDATKGRLHVSMASLGLGSATSKSVLQCNVGEKSPVFLCCLYPEKLESQQLNVEFEEVDDVIFSVIGTRSIHLSGYYLTPTTHDIDHELESHGEDIAETESNKSSDSDGDSYEDSFINDGEVEVFPPSPDDQGALEKSCDNRKKYKTRRILFKADGSPIPKKNAIVLLSDDNINAHSICTNLDKVVDLKSESNSKLDNAQPIRNDENKGGKRRKLSKRDEERKREESVNEKNVSVEIPEHNTNSELVIEELRCGKQEGQVAISGKKISVRYVCKMMNTGEVVDSNAEGRLFKFRLGAKRVIDAWEVGLQGMKVGEIRRLIVPPLMGYGSEGNGKNIPPDSWLVYEIELVKVR